MTADQLALPCRRYLNRRIVLEAVGGRRQLQTLEAEGLLRRVYPGGLKLARYVRAEVENVLCELRQNESLTASGPGARKRA